MNTFSIPKPHGFSLAAASQFFAAFTPGSGMAAASADGAALTLAFRLDRSFDAVAVALHEEPASLVAHCEGTSDMLRLRAQIARILGLEADGDAWLDVGGRDPVVGMLQAEFPGFFTVAKPSPYDAACWAIIAPRLPMTYAARLKMELARVHGDALCVNGETHHVFPAPARLATLDAFPGLSTEKVERLRGVAAAALEGKLDAEYLRDLGEVDAIRELSALRGVGAWSAGHIYYRGAAPIDALPLSEPRVLHGFASAYAMDRPDARAFSHIAERWRPFRMWVCVLLSRHLARTGGWNKPGLTKERRMSGIVTSGSAAPRRIAVAANR